ncbi:MAG: hypothetical protein KDD58_10835 [Bdellovibrionales bacterium]|nr:hypothetical protein [Bdellovibrionales bacterium]
MKKIKLVERKLNIFFMSLSLLFSVVGCDVNQQVIGEVPNIESGYVPESYKVELTTTSTNVQLTEGDKSVFVFVFDSAIRHDADFNWNINASAEVVSTQSGTVGVKKGDTSFSINLEFLEDVFYEQDASYSLEISSLFAKNNIQVNIELFDNDLPALLTASDLSINEGSNQDFTLSIDHIEDHDITFDFAIKTGNTATEITDFTMSAYSGSITLLPGETSSTINIAAIADSLYETATNEFFVIEITNLQGADISIAEYTITIVEQDPLPTLSIADINIDEGSSGNLTLSLDVPSTEAISIDYSVTDNSATQIIDYSLTNYSGTISFDAGEVSKTLNINTVHDYYDEGNSESFYFNISNPIAVQAPDTQAIVTIDDNDITPNVSWSVASQNVMEDTVTVSVTVNITPTFPTIVDVGFSLSGDLVFPADHDLNISSVSIPANQSSTSFNFNVVNDSDLEAIKTIVLTQTTLNYGAWTGSATHTINVYDDDTPREISFSSSGKTVTENDGQNGNVNIDINYPLGSNTAFTYTISGDASSGSDFSGATGSISLPAWSSSVTIPITVVNNSLYEYQETLVLDLDDPLEADPVGITQYTLTINDDDPQPSVSISDATHYEGCSAIVEVTATGMSQYPMTFDLSTTNGTALAGIDYTSVNLVGESISSGKLKRRIAIPLIDDNPTIDGSEQFNVNISNIGVATAGDLTSTVTINEPNTEITLHNANFTTPNEYPSEFYWDSNGCMASAEIDKDATNWYAVFAFDLGNNINYQISQNTIDNNYDISSVHPTFDFNHIVYRGDLSTNGRYGLWSADILGNDVYTLYENSTNDSYLPQISPDSNKVSFIEYIVSSAKNESIKSINIDGSNVQTVTDPFGNGGCINTTLGYNDDSSKAIFTGDYDSLGLYELYSNTVDGLGTPLKLHPDLPSHASINFKYLTPDKTKVVFTSDIDTDGIYELYKVNVDGTGFLKLNSPFHPGITRLTISPDSQKVMFLDYQNNVMIVNIDGTNETLLTTQVDQVNAPNSTVMKFTPDSTKAVIYGELTTDNIYEIASVNVDGTNFSKLNGPLPAGQSVRNSFEVRNNRVFFYYYNANSNFQLYTNTHANTDLIQITSSGVETALIEYIITEDGQDILLRECNAGIVETHRLKSDGTGKFTLDSSGNIYKIYLEPNTKRALYFNGLSPSVCTVN